MLQFKGKVFPAVSIYFNLIRFALQTVIYQSDLQFQTLQMYNIVQWSKQQNIHSTCNPFVIIPSTLLSDKYQAWKLSIAIFSTQTEISDFRDGRKTLTQEAKKLYYA